MSVLVGCFCIICLGWLCSCVVVFICLVVGLLVVLLRRCMLFPVVCMLVVCFLFLRLFLQVWCWWLWQLFCLCMWMGWRCSRFLDICHMPLFFLVFCTDIVVWRNMCFLCSVWCDLWWMPLCSGRRLRCCMCLCFNFLSVVLLLLFFLLWFLNFFLLVLLLVGGWIYYVVGCLGVLWFSCLLCSGFQVSRIVLLILWSIVFYGSRVLVCRCMVFEPFLVVCFPVVGGIFCLLWSLSSSAFFLLCVWWLVVGRCMRLFFCWLLMLLFWCCCNISGTWNSSRLLLYGVWDV